MSDDYRPFIVCAAVKLDNVILCGPRHWDNTMRAQFACMTRVVLKSEEEQGFIDQRGKFYTRLEAYPIAEHNGQIKRRFDSDSWLGLCSENLY